MPPKSFVDPLLLTELTVLLLHNVSGGEILVESFEERAENRGAYEKKYMFMLYL